MATATDGEEQNVRRFWLVRHGLTTWNRQQRFYGHSNVPLSPQGQAQACWLAQQLCKEIISTIYTSDLLRAQETAEIIATQRLQAVPVKISSAWREIDFGAWEGLTYSEIAVWVTNRIGRLTGDSYGAIEEVIEVVALLTLLLLRG